MTAQPLAGHLRLPELLTVAQAAVDLALEVLANGGSCGVRWKDVGDPVSDLDVAVESEVRAFLADATPHVQFLGEEGVPAGSSTGHAGVRNSRDEIDAGWVLDPIDGTVNFLHGLPLHAVSLGLLIAGDPALGVIAMPALGTRYWAHQGGGAYRDGIAITCSRTLNLRDAVVSIGDYATGENATTKNRTRLAVTSMLADRALRVRMLGTAATDLAWVADGTIDATVLLTSKPWDITAGVAIAREAGVAVVDGAGARHSSSSNSVVAAGSNLVDELAEAVATATTPP